MKIFGACEEAQTGIISFFWPDFPGLQDNQVNNRDSHDNRDNRITRLRRPNSEHCEYIKGNAIVGNYLHKEPADARPHSLQKRQFQSPT